MVRLLCIQLLIVRQHQSPMVNHSLNIQQHPDISVYSLWFDRVPLLIHDFHTKIAVRLMILTTLCTFTAEKKSKKKTNLISELCTFSFSVYKMFNRLTVRMVPNNWAPWYGTWICSTLRIYPCSSLHSPIDHVPNFQPILKLFRTCNRLYCFVHESNRCRRIDLSDALHFRRCCKKKIM